MTINLTATPVAPTTTTAIPANGEDVDSDSVALYAQKLINEGAYRDQLLLRLPGANPASSLISIPYAIGLAAQGGTDWTRSDVSPSAGGVVPSYVNSGSVGAFLYIPLNGVLIPNGMKIVSLNVMYCGSLGHGALPAVMPKVELIKQVRGAGGLLLSIPAPTVIDTVIDGSSNVTLFQNVHFISKVLGAPELFDSSQLYSLRVTAESGANAQNSGRVLDNGYVEVSA